MWSFAAQTNIFKLINGNRPWNMALNIQQSSKKIPLYICWPAFSTPRIILPKSWRIGASNSLASTPFSLVVLSYKCLHLINLRPKLWLCALSTLLPNSGAQRQRLDIKKAVKCYAINFPHRLSIVWWSIFLWKIGNLPDW